MKRITGWIFGCMCLFACHFAHAKHTQQNVKTPSNTYTLGLRTPALSPDGTTLALSYQGDIWRVSLKTYQAIRLTAHPAYDGWPRWSPDGTQILFTSKRSGNNDVYVMPSQGGIPRRLTFHSSNDLGTDWSPDGTWVVFASSRANARSLYRVSVRGGLPKRIVPGYWNWVFGGRVGPQGKRLLFSEGMEGWKFWWRKGYKGPNFTRLHVYDLQKKRNRVLNKGPHNALWPMWSATGKGYYYMSEKSGVGNLMYSALDGTQTYALTQFKHDPIRWPSMNKKGTHIVFERNFRLWIVDLSTRVVRPLPIRIQTDQIRSAVRWKSSRSISEFALSPDGKKIAFVSEGDVFVTDAMARTAIRPLTRTPWREKQVLWGRDSRHVLYTSERGKGYILVKRLATVGSPEKVVLRTKQMIHFPSVSPDGKKLVFLSGKNRWMLLQKGTQAPRLLMNAQSAGLLGHKAKWSPDSQWVMFIAYDRARGHLWAKRVTDTSAPIRLTRTAAHASDGAWTPDGKYVLYQSNQYGTDWFHTVRDTQLFALSLRHKKPVFKEDKLDALFKVKASKKSTQKTSKEKLKATSRPSSRPVSSSKSTSKNAKKKKNVKIDVEGLEFRMRRLTALRGNEAWPLPAPKGPNIVFFSNSLGATYLYKAQFKDGKLKGIRQLTRSLRFRGLWSNANLTWHPSGKALYLLHRGSIVRVGYRKGRIRRLPLRVSVRIERQARFVQMFREVWLTLREHFYDPKMHGQDWNALYTKFLPIIQRVRTQEDWRAWMNELLGWLNASHLGVYNPRSRALYSTGALGIDWSWRQGKLWIDTVLKHGPVYKVLRSLQGGQAHILSIQGRAVAAHLNPVRWLRNTRGKRVSLKLRIRKPGTSSTWKEKTIYVKPIHVRAERHLRYVQWVEERKAWVKKWSRGTIGYLHMRNMGQASLRRFIRDYETHLAHKRAAIIDVRFNMGGNIHDTVLQYLSRRHYANWKIRGLKTWSEPSHAVLPKPMAMMINQVTLSDGEMTASGFKALKLGTLVGTATYRWLIFTYQQRLLNGGAFRLPDWGCYTTQGKNLEKTGVTPDVVVHNTLSDRLNQRDPQLKKTVQLLQSQLKKKTNR